MVSFVRNSLIHSFISVFFPQFIKQNVLVIRHHAGQAEGL